MFAFSLIVPVYNAGDFLADCMESLLEQSYGRYEIILVNDGSTDGSGEMCERIALHNSSLVKLIHQENKGVSAARNAALDVAKGDYVLFVDADDRLSEGALLALDKCLAANRCDVLCFGNDVIDENGHARRCRFRHESRIKAKQFSLKDFRPAVWSYMISLNLIQKEGIRFVEQLRYSEDSNFLFKCLCSATNVAYLDTRIYNYRIHRNSAIHKEFTYDWANANLIAAKDALSYLRNKGDNIQSLATFLITYYIKHFLVMFFRTGNREKDKAIQDFMDFYLFVQAGFDGCITRLNKMAVKHLKFVQYIYCVDFFVERLIKRFIG